MVQSPRDGVQPIEFMDEAFYSILGADLARTGVETIYLAIRFRSTRRAADADLVSLGGIVACIGGHRAHWYRAARRRHFVVLPCLLLAAAALTGTLVRRVARTTSTGALVFGFSACLFLAPIPLISGPYFSDWAVGLMFGITLYGLAAVAVLLATFCMAVLSGPTSGWALPLFVGSVVASILPAHLVIAGFAVIGFVSAWAIGTVRCLISTGRPPAVATGVAEDVHRRRDSL